MRQSPSNPRPDIKFDSVQ